MKRLIIAILALCVATPAMARDNSPRYKVYDFKLSGFGLEVKRDKGWWIENGEKEKIDKFVKSGGSLRGYIIVDTWMGDWANSLFIEKGGYEQNGAGLYFDFKEHSYLKVKTGENVLFRLYEKGMAVVTLDLPVDEMQFNAILIGSWKEYRKEMVKKGETNMVWTCSFNAYGAGQGWGPIDGYDEEQRAAVVKEPKPSPRETGVVVKNARLKYNRKISNSMWAEYMEANPGGTNEVDGVEAAADVLNKWINKKAKIDDADFYLPGAMG